MAIVEDGEISRLEFSNESIEEEEDLTFDSDTDEFPVPLEEVPFLPGKEGKYLALRTI